MPYASNADLPPAVANHLPPHAQHIFRAAFKHARDAARDARDGDGEAAFPIAWAAVKRHYRKQGDHWVPHRG